MIIPLSPKGELRFKKVYKIDVSLCVEFVLLNKEQKDERSVATKA
jgi:hypothetical protein